MSYRVLILVLSVTLALGCSKSDDSDVMVEDGGTAPPPMDTIRTLVGEYYGHWTQYGWAGPNSVSDSYYRTLLVSEDSTGPGDLNVELFGNHLILNEDLTLTPSTGSSPFFEGSFHIDDSVRVIIDLHQQSPNLSIDRHFEGAKPL